MDAHIYATQQAQKSNDLKYMVPNIRHDEWFSQRFEHKYG
jgi:hypothetical protein